MEDDGDNLDESLRLPHEGEKLTERFFQDGEKFTDRFQDGEKFTDRFQEGEKLTDRFHEGEKLTDRFHEGEKLSDRLYKSSKYESSSLLLMVSSSEPEADVTNKITIKYEIIINNDVILNPPDKQIDIFRSVRSKIKVKIRYRTVRKNK